MFTRFRRVESHLQVRLQVSVAESRRVDGKVHPEHIAALGSVGDPATIAERVAFWGQLHRRLAALSNRIDAEAQAKIIGSIHDRIPMVTIDGMQTLQRENAEADTKFWEDLQGMSAEQAEGHKNIAAKSARIAADAEKRAAEAAAKAAAARDRLDRLAKGEDVSGGLGKPMTRVDVIKIVKAEGWTASDIRFSMELASLHTEEDFQAFVTEMCEARARAEKSSRWKTLRKIKAKRTS
jgi:hypothetical protein